MTPDGIASVPDVEVADFTGIFSQPVVQALEDNLFFKTLFISDRNSVYTYVVPTVP